jgi:hypothetical protein
MPGLCEECEHDLIPAAEPDEFLEWATRDQEVREAPLLVVVSAAETNNADDPGGNVQLLVLDMLSEWCL